MTDITFTPEQFTEAMEKVVAEKGEDYIYVGTKSSFTEINRCTYAKYENGDPVAPSCLIGHVLVELGATLKDLRMYESAPVAEILAGFNVSRRYRLAAQRAQSAQDAKRTWGEALKIYRQTLEEDLDD